MNIEDVRAARRRIGDRVRPTPVLRGDGNTWFKLEYTQHAGSFKTRGMFNQIIAAAERGILPTAGIVAASGGNAGLAAAYAARELRVPAVQMNALSGEPLALQGGVLAERCLQPFESEFRP